MALSMMDVEDTIAAIATARGGALRGIVRVSGPRAIDCLNAAFTASESRRLPSAVPLVASGMVHCEAPVGDVPGAVYVWPTARSYTRQPSFEVHTIGSLPVLEAVLEAVCRAGARLAQPGEFTLRAFLAGRLDLTQAEAVLGVIDSRSAAELETALRQLAGGLFRPLQSIRERLLDVLAHLEAGLDFVEEEIEFISRTVLERDLRESRTGILQVLQQISQRGESVHESQVTCIGWPNVGKSSLFNALAGDSAAIVSDVVGTTRDYVTRRVDIGGLAILLTDTAGIEPAGESAGLTAASRAMRELQSGQSALCLFCIDASRPLNDWERAQLTRDDSRRIVVRTKSDLPVRGCVPGNAVATSAATGAGLSELRAEIRRRLQDPAEGEAEVVASTGLRCRDSLVRADECLGRAESLAHAAGEEELIAAELRHALDELGSVVGTVYTDDILDRIFSRFCIGK